MAHACTHIESSIDVNRLLQVFNPSVLRPNDARFNVCRECVRTGNVQRESRELWYCLKCGVGLCGITCNGHALNHYQQMTSRENTTGPHELVVFRETFAVYCYECERQVLNVELNLQQCVDVVRRFFQRHLYDLESSVLSAIFKMISLTDLLNVAHASKRMWLEVQNYVQAEFHNVAAMKYVEATELLRRFGRTILEINISYYDFINMDDPNEWLLLISQYCAGTLRELELHGVDISSAAASAMAPSLLGGLLTLKLHGCDLSRCEAFLFFCSNLTELILVNTKLISSSELGYSFRRLSDITLYGCRLDDVHLHGLIKANMHFLKSLSIRKCGVTSSLFRSIATARKLESLEFHCDGDMDDKDMENSEYLAKLPKLTTLKLECDFSVNPLLGKCLEYNREFLILHLKLASFNEPLVRKLSQMNSLTVLHLDIPDIDAQTIKALLMALTGLRRFFIWPDGSVNGFNVEWIVRRGGSLQTLEIKKPQFQFDWNLYGRLVSLLQNEKRSFNIIIHSSPDEEPLPLDITRVKGFLRVSLVNIP